jgi:hypothetical protein
VGSIPAQPTRICNRNNGLQEIVAFFFVQNFNADLMCGFLFGECQKLLRFDHAIYISHKSGYAIETSQMLRSRLKGNS